MVITMLSLTSIEIVKVWISGVDYSVDFLAETTPFVDVWRELLPVVLMSTRSLHGYYSCIISILSMCDVLTYRIDCGNLE